MLAQNKQTSDKKFDLYIGLSDYGSFMSFKTTNGIYNLGLDYRITKYFGLGLQVGYGQLLDQYGTVQSEGFTGMHLYRYAAVGDFHLLPLFIESANSKLDLFVRGTIGGQYAKATDDYSGPDSYNKVDYGAYFGISYNPIKVLGIYGLIGYGNFSFTQFGLSVSF